MTELKQIHGENWDILQDSGWPNDLKPRCFKSDFFKSKRVSKGGRNAAWFISTPLGNAVLRHYRRGGLLARLVRKSYVYRPFKQCRAYQEFMILHTLHEQGLAVPKPLAALQKRKGLLARMSIMTQTINKAQPLTAYVQRAIDQGQDGSDWIPECAHAIKAMHDAGVWHADLNAFNILITQEPQGFKAWIIDFDKAKQKTLTKQDRLNNLQRLKRSLLKVCGQASEVFWTQICDSYHKI